MFIDFDTISPKNAYKLLVSTVVPRPIAWVVTQNPDGRVNAAPFSFFNAFSGNPPIVCIGVGGRESGVAKDTAINIELTGEFVVNLVSEDLAQRMNVTAVDFDYGIDEMQEAGLTKVPSEKIGPPRIGESPVSMECVKHDIYKIGQQSLVIGRVVAMHIRDELMIDPAKYYVDTPKLGLIGRLHGSGMYVRITDIFEMPRVTRAERTSK